MNCKVTELTELKGSRRTSLVVQWLGLHASTPGAQVQSLVGELTFCMLHGTAPKNTNKKIKGN